MTITETVALTLVASGGLSFYLIIRAMVDFLLIRPRLRDGR